MTTLLARRQATSIGALPADPAVSAEASGIAFMREVFTRETLTEAKVRKMVLREAAPFAVNAGSTGVTAWALRHNIAKGHLSSFMDGKRGPGTDVLNALDLEWRICRKRAASAIEARRAETHSGSVHESAVAESETPDRPSHWSRNLPGVR